MTLLRFTAVAAIMFMSTLAANAYDERYPSTYEAEHVTPQKVSFSRNSRRQVVEYEGRVVANPPGCPARAFCGCGSSIRVFGRPVRELFLAANWRRFPPASCGPGMAMWRHGHVAIIEQCHGDGTVTAYDPNSGNHQTRIHRISLAGYRIVNPHGGGHASNDRTPQKQEALKLASYEPNTKIDGRIAPMGQKAIQRPPHEEMDLSSSSYAGDMTYDYLKWHPRPLTIEVRPETLRPLRSPVREIERASFLFGVPFSMMWAIAKVESDFNPREVTGSYKGLFQLSSHEFEKYGSGDIYDAKDNALAAGKKFATEMLQFEDAVGRKASYFDVYLIHQQGWEGAAEHVAQPDRIAWQSMCATEDGRGKGERWCKKAIWGNVPSDIKSHIRGGVEALTSGEFMAIWRKRVEFFAKHQGGEYPHEVSAQKTERHVRHHRSKKYRMAQR